MSSDRHGTEAINRAGVGLATYRIERDLGWIFREQTTSDYGVDAHVEIRAGAKPTGRLVGVQLKSSSSGFSGRVQDGWIYRPDDRHVNYWLGHSLPMYVLFVDLVQEQIYWQRVLPGFLSKSSRGGWKILIPDANILPMAREEWEVAASGIESQAAAEWSQNLEVLPPSTVKHLKALSNRNLRAASMVAKHLASSRTVPELVVATLIEAKPVWLVESGSDGLIAVGEFASAHLLNVSAADAYDQAAGLDDARAGQLRAAAGFELLEVDPDRASLLFEQAERETGGGLLAAVGIEIVERSSSGGEIVLSPALAQKVSAATTELAMLSFRAQQAMNGGRVPESIALWERALSLAPENTTVMQRLAYALALRSGYSTANPDDLVRARILAEDALERIHKWDGPTGDSLDLLIRIYGLLSEFDRILARATTPPTGIARQDEAGRPRIARHAARAAAVLGRRELLPALLSGIPEGIERDLTETECGVREGQDRAEIVQMYRRVLDLTEEEPETLIEATRRLSTFGIDHTGKIQHLVDRGLTDRSVVEQIQAVAKAYADPVGGIAPLRSLSDHNAAAVEPLILLLLREGRGQEAIDLCSRAAERLHNSTFLAMKVEILSDLERWDEVEPAALRVLGDPALSDALAKSMYRYLMFAAQDRHDWAAVERYAHQSLLRDPEDGKDSTTVWRMIISQLNQRAFSRAGQTVRRFHPNVRDKDEAQLWLRALTLESWDAELASQALVLASKYGSDAELSARLVLAVISSTRAPREGLSAEQLAEESSVDNRPVISAEIRRRAFEALNEHVARHGEAGGIFAFSASTAAELSAQLADLMQDDEGPPLQEVARDIWLGKLPAGVLAVSLDRPYAETLALKPMGVYNVCSILEEENDSDLEVGKRVAGQSSSVVVDSSALLISSLIGEFDYCRGNFANLEMPYESRDDIVRTQVAVRGLAGSSGSVHWDPDLQQLVWREISHEAILALRKNVEHLAEAADRTAAVLVEARIDHLNVSGERMHGSWFAPIELAAHTGLPLWSDDVAQRRLARSLGVSTFSTISLLDVRNDRIIDSLGVDSDRELEEVLTFRQNEMRRCAAQGIVDLPISVDDVLEQARLDEWESAVGSISLTRPAWWIWSPAPLTELHRILREVWENRPECEPAWRAAALAGIAVSLFATEGAAPGLVLAIAVLLPVRGKVVDNSASGYLEVACALAREWGINDPRNQIPAAAERLELAGTIDDAALAVEAALADQV